MTPLKYSFQSCKHFWNRLNRYPEIVTPNKHIYALCCRPEVAGVLISGENVQTIECFAVLHVEMLKLLALAVSEIFEEKFRDGGGGGGRQPSTISSSENSFEFRLKVKKHTKWWGPGETQRHLT